VDVQQLAQHLGLGSLLGRLQEDFGGSTLLEHWTQGEFHHDVVLRLPGERILVVATPLTPRNDPKSHDDHFHVEARLPP
jgi:hypothetical protein